MSKRLVYICDWLPPDFGAVGQYAMLEAHQWAERGFAVTLVGLTSGASSREMTAPIGTGSVEIIRVHRRKYQKQRFVERLIWTIASNLALLRGAFAAMNFLRRCIDAFEVLGHDQARQLREIGIRKAGSRSSPIPRPSLFRQVLYRPLVLTSATLEVRQLRSNAEGMAS